MLGINKTAVPEILAVPPNIAFSQVILRVPPNTVPLSASVSFAKTSTVTVTFLFVEALSSTATGASFTHMTSTVPVAKFDPVGPKVSCNWNTKVSVPQKSASGTYNQPVVIVQFEGATTIPENATVSQVSASLDQDKKFMMPLPSSLTVIN